MGRTWKRGRASQVPQGDAKGSSAGWEGWIYEKRNKEIEKSSRCMGMWVKGTQASAEFSQWMEKMESGRWLA